MLRPDGHGQRLIQHMQGAHAAAAHAEQQLLDRLSRMAPRLVDDLVPKLIPMSLLVRVLQDLLREHIPIHNIRRI